ncbi:MAG: peptide chain release factor N(5)-glutamine methyltransferase [Candidatus Magasanikbacteria bacterium]|nr:peptide chain release factor N(5)-glutamine methyltransferase [Candidatus Magasanikbacteria bacterium]
MSSINSLLKESPTQDREYFLRYLLSMDRGELLMRGDEEVPTKTVQKLRQLERRRTAGTPMQYILGEAWFYGLKFFVTPAVLIPRPETELTVERALAITREHEKCSVLDVGTGSGAIAIAIAKNSSVHVTAIDTSAPALIIARKNARAQKARITFSKLDLRRLTKFPAAKHLIITANLPYLSDKRMQKLSPEVLHEPKLALYGGPDGLDLYRALFERITKICRGHRINQTIHALLEIDPEQKTKLAALSHHEFAHISINYHRDLHGDIRLAELTITF